MDILIEHLTKIVTKKKKRYALAVVHPCSEISLRSALEVADFIDPVIIAPVSKIKSLAEELALDISHVKIIDVPHSHAAVDTAIKMIENKECQLIMKGSLHTEELLRGILNKSTGLRTDRRISHCFVMHIPDFDRLLLITDGAVNVTPNLDDKKDILQNAIYLAHAIGINLPKAAILAATETVENSMQSTLDAAALSKMADRNQITGAIVDGPLAFDNAMSAEAAQIKEINSEVAGYADILLAPSLEAGNILFKELNYFSNAVSAGIVLGAKAPIILTSRADSLMSRRASALLGILYYQHTSKANG